MFRAFSRGKKLDIKGIEERAKKEEKLELERGDIPAMLIAAFAVFTPYLLFLLGSLIFIYWFFVGRF